MENQSCVVMGIDGGGTHTRVMVADLEGRLLAYVERGASSIHKDVHAKDNVQQAIGDALREAGKQAGDVAALTAGVAGFDAKADLAWVEPLTDVPELHCPRQHVNDAVVAHSGALLSEPGIIVVSGTGSIIVAVNEAGQHIRNYDLHHYAASAARFLAYDATYEVLAGNAQEEDAELVEAMFRFWGVSTVEELAQLAVEGFIADPRERNRKFAELAPALTDFAQQHVPLAQLVCDRAIHQIAVGVNMLSAYFAEPEVKVALVGSVVNSAYFGEQLALRMEQGNRKKLRLTAPAFSPAAGAVLMALKELGVEITPRLLANMGANAEARYA
ncbi:BadF/BadG/BcrA/BcrD ATPase family protein [Paenibacillus oryzisoli]|uniref:BadF/BadG/BcrA/BcrD ATPase family protein n=1 Tax=Paenibacillus oryzisoli TaxID=1850517 RepID=UPI003D26C297